MTRWCELCAPYSYKPTADATSDSGEEKRKGRRKHKKRPSNLQHAITPELRMAIDHRLRQVPSQTAGQLRVQVATNRGCRVATTSALHLSPSAQGVVNCLSSSTKRLPGERHKVQTLPATDRERLLKLLVVGILSRHPSFLHRNLNVFLLQWVRYGDVERRRGKAPMVLLHGVSLDPSIWYFFSVTTPDRPAAFAEWAKMSLTLF